MGYMGMNMAGQAGAAWHRNWRPVNRRSKRRRHRFRRQVLRHPKMAGLVPAVKPAIREKFCMNCGKPKPEPIAAWTCPSCGHSGNEGKFCTNCGQPNGVFRLDLPVVRYGQHGEILHELRNEEA